MSDVNTGVISQLVAKMSVEALQALPDPVLRLMYKGYSEEFGQSTYQTGATLRIKIEDQPALPLQQTAAVVDPIVQTEISATVLNWTTGWNVQTAWQALSLGGEAKLREEIVKPRGKIMAAQAAIVAYTELLMCPGFVSGISAGTAVKTATDFGKFRASIMNQQGHESINACMATDDMALVAGDLATAFNPSKDSAFAYLDGTVQRAVGINFYESTLLPNHTNGTAAGTGAAGAIVATNLVSGVSQVVISGNTVSSGTYTVGSIIYFSGIYEVNPVTKQPLTNLRGFTVTEAVTLSGGGGTIKFFPPAYGPENPKLQTCSALPTTANYVGLYGLPSGIYRQMLFFKKNSSAMISVKQAELVKLDNGMADYEGIVVQTAAVGDFQERQNLGRIDMLISARNTQWRWQYRAFTAKLN